MHWARGAETFAHRPSQRQREQSASHCFLSICVCVCSCSCFPVSYRVCVLCAQPHASTGTADGLVIVMTACKTGVAIIVDVTESRTLKLTYT